MANGKKSFVAYVDWKEIFDSLPDEKAGQLAKHLFAYVADLDPETDDLLVKVAFASIKATLKRDLKKWEHYVEKQRVNGAKGGRPKKNPTKAKKPKPFLENPTKPKKPVSVSVSDSVNDNHLDDDYITAVEFCDRAITDDTYLNAFTIPPPNYIKSLIKLRNGQSIFSRHCEKQGKGPRRISDFKSHLTNYAVRMYKDLAPTERIKYA